MANVEIPKNNDNTSKPSSAQDKRAQQQYTQLLAYERAFLKKKEELEKSARIRKLEEDIKFINARKAEEQAAAALLYSNEEELEKIMSQIKLKFVEDISKKEIELIGARTSAEYDAHQFAVQCAEKLLESQNVHERLRTTTAIAEAQKVTAERLRSTKETEIAELESQHKIATSSSEKRKITLQIKKIQQEIHDAEAETVRCEEQAAKYAEIVKKVDFDRLSAADKLNVKLKEMTDLQDESDAALAEIDSKIAAKKLDLEVAISSGDSASAENVSKEISTLEEQKTATSEKYEQSINELREAIESKGGFRDQATKDRGAKVSPEISSDSSEASDVVLTDILKTLTDFSQAFHDYVDGIEDKLSTIGKTTTVTTEVSADKDKGSLESSTVEHLRKLVTATTAGDAEVKASLLERLDRLDELSNKSDSDLTKDETGEKEEILKRVFEILGDAIPESKSKSKSESEESEKSNDSEEDEEKLDAYQRAAKQVQTENDKRAELKEDAVYQRQLQKERVRNFFADNESGEQYRKDAATKAMVAGLNKLNEGMERLSQTIDDNIKDFYKDKAEIDARLQGSEFDFEQVTDLMKKNLGVSGILDQKKFLEKFKELVDAGISYNLESRTFLASVGEKVINTFEVLNGDLQRLIKLQQADTTAARMGLESQLNQLFNKMYSDTSYLHDNVHDSVTSAILEASAMLSRDMSVEFEYMTHKWLGSLYSLGFSSGSLEKIAKGLNYLGTGNVTALNSDESLQALLAMSSAYAGVPYADILTQGLNAETTNKLMSGMLKYLMEIASNTDSSQVVKSAYTEVFGLEMSDLRALKNLSAENIEEISKLSTTYESAFKETQTQLNAIQQRTHASYFLDTMFSNIVTGASLNIGSSPLQYGLWKTLNLVEGLTGGIALPFVNAFGTGLDLHTTVTGIIKAGIAGLNMMGTILGSLGGGLDGRLDLASDWNLKDYTTRGSASTFLASGISSGFSSSSSAGGNSGSQNGNDMKRTEMSDNADSSEEDAQILNKNLQEEQELPQKIYDTTQLIWQAVAEEENTVLRQAVKTYNLLEERLQFGVLDTISGLLSADRIFLTTGFDRLGSVSSIVSEKEFAGTSEFQSVYLEGYHDIVNKNDAVYKTFERILENHVSDLNTDIWSLIDSTGKFTTDLSNYYADDEKGFDTTYKSELKSDEQTALAGANAELDKPENIVLKNYISELAKVQTLNKVIFPEYVRATVDEFGSPAAKFLEQLLRAMADYRSTTDKNSTSLADFENDVLVKQIITAMRAAYSDVNTVVKTNEVTFDLPNPFSG